jgi:hypothetical protein
LSAITVGEAGGRAVQTIRLYNPERSPANWREIIRPGQFVAFATQLDSGVSCDASGALFPSPDAVTCTIFDSLDTAETVCRESVERAPGVRFDIFDSAGRASPALLTVVHPSRVARLEGRRGTRLTNGFAVGLLLLAPFLFWIDWAKYDGTIVLPTIAGINCVIFAARIFFLNTAHATAERARRKRFAESADRSSRVSDSAGPLRD